jgi:hypothetical protein
MNKIKFWILKRLKGRVPCHQCWDRTMILDKIVIDRVKLLQWKCTKCEATLKTY